ncbi:MAG: hypothetical protein J1F03_01340 [Oscillospiraceae bacterium]|nr:hypothetical protein [Oscillospiraceae bacterium]
MLLRTKATKVIVWLCIMALAITAIIPSGFVLPKVRAEVTDNGEEWDFAKGILVTEAQENPKTTETNDGSLTIKPNGSSYYYKDSSHGIVLNSGVTIEIEVSGPTNLTIGDCQYSNNSTSCKLTVKSSDGKYNVEKDTNNGCYHNGSSLVYTYTGGATTLTIGFTGSYIYVPYISIAPEAVPEAGKTYTWDFDADPAIPKDTEGKSEVTSKDGLLTVKTGGSAYRYNGGGHGIEFKPQNSIEIKVAGSTKLTIGDCGYSNPTTLTVKDKNGSYKDTASTTVNGCSGAMTFTYKGEATTLEITFVDLSIYIPYITAEPLEEEESKPEVRPDEPNKTDVWDFGAAKLDESKYNNLLTEAVINSWYPETTIVGSQDKNTTTHVFGTVEAKDFRFVDGKNDGRHRIKTSNTNLTRYETKSNVTIEGTSLPGAVFSNSGSPDVYIEIVLYAGDILTVYAGANNAGDTPTIEFAPPSGETKSGVSNADGVKLTFYATEYGKYKIYAIGSQKLVVYRLEREHTNPVDVSGTVTAPSDIGSDYKISFTNQKSGAVTEAAVENGSYSVTLYDNYVYDVALVDANGYIVSSGDTLDIAKGSSGETHNITISKVALANVTGNIIGLGDKLSDLELEFVSQDESSIFVPEIKIEPDGSFTLQLAIGVTYDMIASGVNDYALEEATIKADGDITDKKITFKAKPVYDITISSNLPDEAKGKAIIIFTHTEDGNEYTFGLSDTIKLRDGQYSVVVKNTGIVPVAQKPTANLTVNGAAVSKEIEFEAISVWDFSKYNGKPGMDTDNDYYLGLAVKNAYEHGVYLRVAANGEVKVPVTKGQMVTATFCNSGTFTINGKSFTTVNSKGSTSKTDEARVVAEETGYLTISVTEQTYFNSIAVSESTGFKDKVTVGPDKDYQTINEALAAVAKMDRPNNERVEIVIDPGNYEEMLVINVPNVSLVNAAGKNSSLQLKNNGVDICDNVVRITSYYGFGYNYYSMGTDCKWNEDVLKANKANGEYTTVNPEGTTNGCYWNATVVVKASGFEANGIVFENSFNQYISKKEADDIVVHKGGTPNIGARPTTYGDTSVQNRSYVERAAAMAIVGDEALFVNCKFVGRQDTLYGGTDIKVAFHKCDILGAVDFIFGPMTAVFYKCNLVMNTDDSTSSDQAYITAAQQKTGRGYLMYECTVTSTTPGVDTASKTLSKPGFFGRPWSADTSEVVFYKTTVETTDYPAANGKSLIDPAGWKDSLKARSSKMYEYGTIEKSGEDNSASRADWTTFLTEPVIDGENITIALFLGNWASELQARSLLLETESDDPEDPEEPDAPEIIEREAEGVKAELSTDALPEGVDPDDVEFKAQVLTSSDNEVLYDLKFVVGGVEIHINGTVTVRLPLPASFKGADVYVYYVDDNNKYTPMNDVAVDTENGLVEFTTTHFSHYLLTTEVKGSVTPEPSEPTEPDDPSGPSTPDDDPSSTPSSGSSSTTPPASNPSTGDIAMMLITPIAAGLISAAAALFIIIRKRRKAK